MCLCRMSPWLELVPALDTGPGPKIYAQASTVVGFQKVACLLAGDDEA